MSQLKEFKLLRGNPVTTIQGKNYILEIKKPINEYRICEVSLLTSIPSFNNPVIIEQYRHSYGLTIKNGISYEDYIREIEDMVLIRKECPISIPNNVDERSKLRIKVQFYAMITMLLKLRGYDTQL
jgi:hypothetical protein